MYRKLAPVLLLCCIFLPFGFQQKTYGQKKHQPKSTSKRSSRKPQVKKSVSSTRVKIPGLPGFGQSSFYNNSVVLMIPNCSADRTVLYVNIYKSQLFNERMVLFNGKVEIVGQNGLHIALSSEITNSANYRLLKSIADAIKPTFMELYPGRDGLLSTLVLTTEKLTDDQFVLVNQLLRQEFLARDLTVNFLSMCQYLNPNNTDDTKPEVNKPSEPPIKP